jgi:hypothetical protein
VPVTGLSMELQPYKKWYTAFITSQNLQAIPKRYVYDRNLHALRIGWGDKEKDHIHFTWLTGKDDKSSVFVDTLRLFRSLIDTLPLGSKPPRQNQVIGSDYRWKLAQWIELEGEWTQSVTAPNTDNGTISIRDFQLLGRLTHKDSADQQRAVSWKAATRIKIAKPTFLSVKYEHIGTHFYSVGNPFLIADIEGYEVKLEQQFAKGKIQLSSSYSHLHDNLIGQKQLTTFIDKYGLQGRFNIKKLPVMTFVFQEHLMDNGLSQQVRISVRNITAQYHYLIGDTEWQTVLTWLDNRNDNQQLEQPVLVQGVKMWQWNQVITFKKPFQLSLTGAYMDRNDGKIRAIQRITEANISYTYLGLWQNAMGYILADDSKAGSQRNIFWESGIDIGKYMAAKLRLESTTFEGKELQNSYKQMAFQLSLVGRIK